MVDPSKNDLVNFVMGIYSQNDVKPLFISVGGSRMYGFSSEKSDYDLRCCHIANTKDVLSLSRSSEVIKKDTVLNGYKVDLVSFEVMKVLYLTLKNNDNVIESILAPSLVSSKYHSDLINLAEGSISKLIYNSYRGHVNQSYSKLSKFKDALDSKTLDNSQFNEIAKLYLHIIRSHLTCINLFNHSSLLLDIDNLVERYYSHSLIKKESQRFKSYSKEFMGSLTKGVNPLSSSIHLSNSWDLDDSLSLLVSSLKKIKSGDYDNFDLYSVFDLSKATVDHLSNNLEQDYSTTLISQTPREYVANSVNKFLFNIRMENIF